MKKMVWVLAAAVFLSVMGCQEEGSKKSVEVLSQNEDEWDASLRTPYDEDGKVDSSKIAIFEWEAMDYDFGTVPEGKMVEFSYKFKNVGSVPLIIARATGSCGCTVPSRPEAPVPPGETGEIKVRFNSKGRVGNNTKMVTLIANTLPKETKLRLTGIVKKQ